MDIRHINIDWKPELERPVLIAGFTGWNDAADAASVAVGALANSWEARRFGGFDGEEFFDFQTTRPQVKLVNGVTREIQWPENMLSATKPNLQAAGSRGAVLLTGPEPNFRWRAFSTAVVELARALKVELVVTMGALLSANSQDATLVESLGLSASRYEGPTGITGVLHRVCADGGLPSVSFWASVPHYLPAVPSAPAALALLDKLSGLLGMEVDTADLESTAETYQEQVSVAVSQDSDLSSYVRMLEERFDSQADQGPRNLPSGDELAQELEGFLREHRREEE
jgi:proteasome assembly chaperone (PAC2) family protein